MTPESGIMERPTILEEAKVLTHKILERQKIRNQQVAELVHDDAITIREEMGYGPAEEVNTDQLIDTRIKEYRPAVQAKDLNDVLSLTKKSAQTTLEARRNIEKILKDEDDRIVVIIGPCSIHDPEAAVEYADRVIEMRERYGNDLEIVMRAYLEKPRSVLGWKGETNQPELGKPTNISLGVTVGRMLLLQITNKGVPVANERVDGRTTQYFDGLVAYDPIGARDSTSTRGRNYLSVTSAIGAAKNSPDGNPRSAVQAVAAAAAEHTYLGDDKGGQLAEIESTGNDTVHVILRGGDKGPNYFAENIAELKQMLSEEGLNEVIGVDASHDNAKLSNGEKDHRLQTEVIEDLSRQIALGEAAIKLVMIESNLVAGKQDHEKLLAEGKELRYGQSITDACAGLKASEKMLEMLSKAVRARRKLIAQI